MNIATPPRPASNPRANPGGFPTNPGTLRAQPVASICKVMSYTVGLLLGQKSQGYENAYRAG